jgi:uncharacterized protein
MADGSFVFFVHGKTMAIILYKSFIMISIFFHMCLAIAPYWIMGIAIGSAITQVLSIEKLKSNRLLYGFPGILTGAFLGVISPIGLYGALPIAMSFAGAGVPVATIFAFLISTPLINPNLFIFTAGVFGYSMAFARLFSALLLGIIGGCCIWTLCRMKKESLLVSASLTFSYDKGGNGHGCTSESSIKKGSIKGFFREFYHFLRFSLPYFLIAIVIAVAIEVLVPKAIVRDLLGSHNPFSVVIATLLSIPLYVCGGNTIPFIHELVNSGMNRGAALAFFIAGPATKISNITFLTSMLGVRGVKFFLMITIGAAYVLGYCYGFVRF